MMLNNKRCAIFICTMVLSAAAVAVTDKEPLTWGGRPVHPAVVNPVLPIDNVLSLRGEWTFSVPDRDLPNRNGIWGNFNQKQSWKSARPIQVPGCWEYNGVGTPGEAKHWDPTWDHCAKTIRHKYMGEGWYRKDVTIPAEWAGKRIWLKIGGVKSIGWVWVNDRQVAHVDNYCATEKYEITDLVKPGESSKIVIDVDNRKPSRKGLMSSVHCWGGIYRDVELEATEAVLIDDAWVHGNFDARTAEVNVEVEGNGDGLKLRATVEGETVEKRLSGNVREHGLVLPLRRFRPWSPESPNLYTAKVELVSADGRVLQTRRERFGVRKFEVRGREFYLNGSKFYVRGFGDDSVYPITGMPPADRDVHRRNLAKARAAGFNFARLHTHCEVPEYFEAADEVGILIQAELPYYSDVPCEAFAFDPVRDVTELWRHYRRYPSFAVYCNGNEGSFGDVLDVRLHKYVKKMDPTRLKICQDSNRPHINAPDRADFCGGPIRVWDRGTFDPGRPFVTHEYLNLCVKSDPRDEAKYTGTWLPPATREKRNEWLAKFSLKPDWADRLQNAQNTLQKIWQKDGIESARLDPFCRGYCFWTIVDVVVWNKKSEAYSAQGLLNPMWEEKIGGSTLKEFARFNSPSCVLVDFCPTQSVFTAGDRFRTDVYFAHYEGAPLADARAEWKLVAGDRTLASGGADVGPQDVGNARKIATFDVSVPDVEKPVKATFAVSVGAVENSWDLWLFPRGASLEAIRAKAARAGVCIAASGSPEAKAALAAGRPLVTVDGTGGKPNVKLGWWWMGSQVGTAIRDHRALGSFPHEGVLTPLMFRILKQGRELPAPGIDSDDMIIVGEGGEKCYLYLAERKVGNSRVFECHGLDLLSGLPEANWLLDSLVSELANGKSARRADPQNFDFSRGMDGWRARDPNWRIDSRGGRNGSACAVWEGKNGRFAGSLSRKFPAEAGGVYRVGVWAKTDNLTLNSRPTKPVLCCGYSDRNGKYIGSFWGREVVDNLSKTDGWRYIEGITPPLPSGAAHLSVSLTFRDSVEGKVAFDDLSLEQLGSDPIAYVISSRYRDEASVGKVDFRSLLQLNLVKYPLESLRPVFRYTGVDGRVKEVAPSVVTPSEISVTLDVADLTLGRQDVTLVVRDAKGNEIASEKCPFTRLAKMARPRVWFDEHNRAWVDGKKFFPLGFCSPGDGKDPRRWEPYYARLTNGVINCLMPIYARASVESIRRFDAAGVKTIYTLREWLSGTRICKPEFRSRAASLAKIREVVDELKDEPGIIAWYVLDEAPLSQAPYLKEVRSLLHEIDPDRPVYAVTDKPYDVRPFAACFDVIGMDPYPIGNHGGAKIDIASKWPLRAAEATWHSKPMWQVPQTFNWWWERKTEDNPEHRFPRRDELANMLYQAVAAGANGLISFSLSGTTRPDKDGTRGFERTLEIYKELRSRLDLFLSDPGPSVTAMPAGAIARTWRHEDGTVSVLVVNTTRQPVSGGLSVTGMAGRNVALPALGYEIITLK